MMKKTLRYLTMLIMLTILAVSCTKEEVTYDQTLLTGKWQSGTLFYKYLATAQELPGIQPTM